MNAAKTHFTRRVFLNMCDHLECEHNLLVHKVSGIYATQEDWLLDPGRGVWVFPRSVLRQRWLCRRRRSSSMWPCSFRVKQIFSLAAAKQNRPSGRFSSCPLWSALPRSHCQGVSESERLAWSVNNLTSARFLLLNPLRRRSLEASRATIRRDPASPYCIDWMPCTGAWSMYAGDVIMRRSTSELLLLFGKHCLTTSLSPGQSELYSCEGRFCVSRLCVR